MLEKGEGLTRSASSLTALLVRRAASDRTQKARNRLNLRGIIRQQLYNFMEVCSKNLKM